MTVTVAYSVPNPLQRRPSLEHDLSLIALPFRSRCFGPVSSGSVTIFLVKGHFRAADLAQWEVLRRLEHCWESSMLEGLVGKVIGWFRHHPSYEMVKRLFTELITRTAWKMAGNRDFHRSDKLAGGLSYRTGFLDTELVA